MVARPVRSVFLAAAAILASFTLMCARPAHACLWLYGTDAQGERVMIEGTAPDDYMAQLLVGRAEPGYWAARRTRFEELAPDARDYKARSDYAVALIHLGDVAAAIDVLEAVEADQPGEYIVASNLGTAMEMAGRLEEAAHWIGEGVRRNPDAHWGSEWIHLAIIEAKRRAKADSAWLSANGVLGLEFGANLAPVAPPLEPPAVPGAPADLEEITRHLQYQLHERLAVVGPPDAVVGVLLCDLAHLLALTRSVEFAIPVLELALDYGPPDPALARTRLAHFKTLVAANPRSLDRATLATPWYMYIELALIVVIPFVVLFVIIRYIRKRRRAARLAARGDSP